MIIILAGRSAGRLRFAQSLTGEGGGYGVGWDSVTPKLRLVGTCLQYAVELRFVIFQLELLLPQRGAGGHKTFGPKVRRQKYVAGGDQRSGISQIERQTPSPNKKK